MTKIKIKALTPVHIGSGNFLQNGTEYIRDKEYLGVIDERKLLQIIGEDKIEMWVNCIEKNENLWLLIKKFKPNSDIEDICSRIIYNFEEKINPTDTLKEQLHNGLGVPYIPGSSLKGAIRTAIFTSLITERNINVEQKVNDYKPSAGLLEKDLFGNDPNTDLLRFLKVGDSLFEDDTTIATKMYNLNIRSSKGLFDKSKGQLIECIGQDSTSEFSIKLEKQYYQKVYSSGKIKELPEVMSSLQNILLMIQEYTKKQLDDEISFWMNYDEDEYALDYISRLSELQENIRSCDSKSCVIRLGHGSGWQFITGGWAKNDQLISEDFFENLLDKIRPQNYRYTEYPFPKTRRIDADADILGFVKLSIIE